MRILNCPRLLIIAGFGFLLSGCSGGSGDSGNRGSGNAIPAVEAVRARYGSLPLTQRLSGVVKAHNQIEIYSEISAIITEVYVDNGNIVKEGQPLVRLRDKEFAERLKQAKASHQIALAQAKQADAELKKVRSDLSRTKALAEKGLASDAELEAIETRAASAEADVQLARARVEQAQATVDEREEALSQTVIRAPVAGSVGNRNAEVGMLVNSGQRLFTLGQLDKVKVEIVLTDRMLAYIKKGQKAEISAESIPDGPLTGSISRISPFLHPVAHSTDAEIDMPNPDRALKPGMFVAVDIHYGESEQATLVPLSALYENPVTGGTGIFVSDDSLTTEMSGEMSDDRTPPFSDPVEFKFVPVEVLAKGRMDAGIRGADPDNWVVTLGQDLLGGDTVSARVRPVDWAWVLQLQHLQREDLLEDLIRQQQGASEDAAPAESTNRSSD